MPLLFFHREYTWNTINISCSFRNTAAYLLLEWHAVGVSPSHKCSFGIGDCHARCNWCNHCSIRLPSPLPYSRGTLMSVTATYRHEEGFLFNVFYRTRGGFLRALTRSKKWSLNNAVDATVVIRPDNLKQYIEGKLKWNIALLKFTKMMHGSRIVTDW